MRISLDYDGTYTVNPMLWDDFIDSCVDHGIDIVVVTFRGPEFPIDHDPRGVKIYYTSGMGKDQYMKEQGVPIDIWIDDMPELIHHDSAWTQEEKERWAADKGVTVVTAG